MAAFADRYGDAFHRIEALAETDGSMRVIDMKMPAANKKVMAFKEGSPENMYRSDLASDYDLTPDA